MSYEPSKRLSNPDELLHRQVHPNFLRDGRLTSQAFLPTPKDGGYLSVARNSIDSAKDAYLRHTQKKGLKSAGTWSVSVSECSSTGADAFEDPLANDNAHAVVEFLGLSNSQVKARADRLARFATERGRQHP